MTEASERNIRLLIEYDGAAYKGWQVQLNCPSIQGALLAAIREVTGEEVMLTVAGRTDAGVHALGQVANFRTTSAVPAERFAAALNTKLPRDITVHASCVVAPEFDARHSAHSKRYRYRVYQGPQPAALERQQAWHVRRQLDVAAMQEAALCLVGEHDFEAFRSAHCDAPHARRRMHAVTVSEHERPPVGRQVDIVFHADAFCRHMCRILAGTLVEVGMRRRQVANVGEVLAARDRNQAGVTAPACGLTLLEVLYAQASRPRAKRGER